MSTKTPFIDAASDAELDDAQVVLLPVPYEKTTSYMTGTASGPQAILEASEYLEYYDDELRSEVCRGIAIHTLPYLRFDGPPEGLAALLRGEVAAHVAKERKVFLLGGEHSISLGAIEAIKERHPSLSIFHIDAHSDLKEQYEGSRYGHASVMRRVLELCPITQVGIRALDAEEASLIERDDRVQTFFACELPPVDQLIERVLATLGDPVYLSIDVDGLDPSVIPGTGTPEPGGLDWLTTTKLLRAVARERNVVGGDVVELRPLPETTLSEFTTAKLLYKMIGYSCVRS